MVQLQDMVHLLLVYILDHCLPVDTDMYQHNLVDLDPKKLNNSMVHKLMLGQVFQISLHHPNHKMEY
jgi:hypothetical protein